MININKNNNNVILENDNLTEQDSNESFFDEINSYKGKWYVANCYSGHEDKVSDDIQQRIESLGMKEYIFSVKVVKETFQSKKNKRMVEKNLYPGYIFINMIMTDEAWYIVRNTPGVTGFIGSSGKGTKPLPLTEKETKSMLKKTVSAVDENKKTKKIYTADFIQGDYVKVLDGLFANKEGQVASMDYTKGIAIVNIELFGRLTPTEVEFDNCQRLG